MNSVGIFRLNFPEISETFIRGQMANLRRYTPVVYAKRRVANAPWPVAAVSDFGPWAQRRFLFTRTTRWHADAHQPKPRLLHAHFGVDGAYALPLARNLNVPLVTTFHGFDILTRPTWWLRHPSLPTAIYRLHFNDLRQSGGRFIAVSRYVEQALLLAGFPRNRVVQHYIGVDTDRFQPAPPELESGSRYILCVGRHVEFKGIDILLQAFSLIAGRHPDVRLLLVGAGPLTEQLKYLATNLGSARQIDFLGAQPQDRVIELMQQAEVFALPSLTQENGQGEALGIVFNEASACGIPVAATLCGGIPEVVIDGETGLLCPERDVKALSENLDRLLSDRMLGKRLGRRGRELICDSFSLSRQTAQLENIYDEACA